AGLDVDRAEIVAVALIDGESQDEAVAARIELGDRRDDAHVRIAVLEIVAAQQLTIRFDAVGIVKVVVLEEAEDAALAGLDHVAQAVARIGAVADEFDLFDARLAAFVDLE